MPNLLNGLGGEAGFGESFLDRNDDGYTGLIDVSAAFENGLNFFGTTYTAFYLNNNGGITFNAPRSEYTPSSIVSLTDNPEIVAFYADVDTRGGVVAATPGGTSQGTNLVWYDIDSENRTVTLTWDDVGYFSYHTQHLNAFQIILSDASGEAGRQIGDFDIQFRYEYIDWTTGTASGGSSEGLGGVVARAGFSAGFGQANAYFELPASGLQDEMLALDTTVGNTGQIGIWEFDIQNGLIPSTISVYTVPPVVPRTEGNDGSTYDVTFRLVRSGDVTTTVTTAYSISGSGANPAGDADLGVFAHTGFVTFLAGQTQAYVTVPVLGDNLIEANEQFTITLSGLEDSATAGYGQQQATATIINDDGVAPPIGEDFIFSTAWGDPHLTTLDGLHYDFQGAGEFILARSVAAGDDFEVQVRTVPINAAVSVITAVAANVDGHRVTYNAGTNTLMVDGVATVIDSGIGHVDVGAGVIYQDAGGGYRIDFPSGAESVSFTDHGTYLDVSVAASPTVQGDIEGLLGNFDGSALNDLSSPGASTTYDPDSFTSADFLAYADGWRVSDATSLFDYAAGETTATFTDADFPHHNFTLADFPTDLVTAAQAAATAAGITDPSLRDSAALDFLLTGDASFLESGAGAEAPTTTAPIDDGGAATPQAIGVGATVIGADERDAGGTAFQFTVYRTSGDGSTTVNWSVTGAGVDAAHSANATDFVGGAFPAGTVVFAAGETERTITIQVQGDATPEFAETFAVSINTPDAGVLVVAPSIVSTINNDDGAVPATMTLSAITGAASEGNSGTTDFSFAVDRTGDTTGASSVQVVLGPDTLGAHSAALATDFTGATSLNVSFAAGETHKVVTFTVSGDTTYENDETFVASLGSAVGGTIAGSPVVSTILNDDAAPPPPPPPPVVTITAAAASAFEGSGGGTTPFTFTVLREGSLAGQTIVTYGLLGVTPDDIDGAMGGTLLFTAGESSKTITVDVRADNIFEQDETLSVSFGSVGYGVFGESMSASTVILNDDAPPATTVLEISAGTQFNYEGNDGSTPFFFIVSRSGDLSGASSADYTISSSASPGLSAGDFVGGMTGSVSFAAGETTKSITVFVKGDTTLEANETFVVTLSAPTGAALATASASSTILNDDTPPNPAFISITTPLGSVIEGDTGTVSVPFIIHRSNGIGVSSANYVISGDVDAADIQGPLNGSVTFANGEMTKTIHILVKGDTSVESVETLTVTLSNLINGAIFADTGEATIFIVNDDSLPPPVLAISALAASANEGNSGTTPFNFQVTRTGDLTVASSASYDITGGTGFTAADVTGVLSGLVSFAAGEASKTVTVDVQGDTVVEANETLTVTLSAPTGATIGTSAASSTILNDDSLPPPPPSSALVTSAALVDGTDGAGQTLPGAPGAQAFKFGLFGGSDVIDTFGKNDSLILGVKLVDGNNDGLITLGRNHLVDLDGPDANGATVDLGPDTRVLRFMGERDGNFVYVDAHTRPSGVKESKVTSDVLIGDDTKADNFFFNTALGLNMGADKIEKFGATDRLVTTTKLFDGNNDGTVTFGTNKFLDLPGSTGGQASDVSSHKGGTVQILGSSGNVITALHFDGQVDHDGSTYYVYSLPGGAHDTGLVF